MKNLRIHFLIFISISIAVSACSKKDNAQPSVYVPPVVVPPTPGGSGGNTGMTISQSLNQESPKTDLDVSVIYSSSTQSSANFKPLPDGYNDNIKSFTLPKGYMVSFAENQNGTGESICYVAAVSDVKENLPSRLVGKVSFVRFFPIKYTNKKGLCNTNVSEAAAQKASWFYNWGLGATSNETGTYAPMTWGKGAATTANALAFIARTDIDHIMSFNEPDNTGQSNIPIIDTAIARYKLMMQTGLRLVSPAVEQDNSTASTDWLPMFMVAATAQKLRVDVIALHWYDWGNEKNNKATDQLTADAILTRFKNYVEKLHAAYPDQNLWFTEYNCNPARSEAVHKLFMQSSAAYLNTVPYVERYAYFFPSSLPISSGAPSYAPTALGQVWYNISSPSALSANIIPK
nr:glycosyl hydrolase [uncultured Pedobacter sp.]